MGQKKQKKKKGKPAGRRNDGPVLMRHPFSGIEPELIRSALAEVGVRKAEEFPAKLAELLSILRSKYPPHILAILANYGLNAMASERGVNDATLIPKINQHHIELLQAFILTIPRDEWNQAPAESGDIQRVIDTVVELAESYHQRRFIAATKEADLQARTVLALQERLRLHTQVVRNWGYYTDVIRISSELYAPLDDALRNAVGFGATDLIAVARAMVKVLEAHSNERFIMLRHIFRERKINRLVRRFFSEYPHIEGDPEAFIRIIPPGTSREAVIARLLSHADIGLVPMFIVDPPEIAAEAGLEADVVKAVLDCLSLEAGGLHGRDTESFFMDNPVWPLPVIRLDGLYYCAMPQAIFSHIHDVMRSLVDAAGLKAKLSERRAEYLETKVEALLGAALPSAQQRHRVKWRDQQVQYETDHLAKLDKTVVIVEDKSAVLTAPALRGAPDRVKQHVRDLVIAPSEQSARLEAMIERAKTGDDAAITALAPFDLDFKDIEQVVRISVTLDDFSVICSAEMELREAGWIAEGTKLATTLNVADFQAAIDILERPSFFVHYFSERQRVQKAIHLFADEMDFLGTYLQTGFNFWELESQENARVSLTGMSQPLDRYYQSRDAGITIPKPKPRLDTYLAALIAAMEKRAFPQWLTVTTDLLRTLSFDEQKKLRHMLDKLRRQVEKNWRDPKHECSIMITPPEIRDTIVVFHVFPEKLAAKRHEAAQDLMSTALEMSGRKRCILISRFAGRWDDPYAFVFVARPQ